MSTSSTREGTATLITLSRPERRRASIEDMEMIGETRSALALLEAKWSVDIIFLLASGMRRHARLADNIPGISKKVLTSTLRRLERHGIVSRQVYPEMPVRVEYVLTPLGWHLTEPLMALYEWAVAHRGELAHAIHADSDPPAGHIGRQPITLLPLTAA